MVSSRKSGGSTMLPEQAVKILAQVGTLCCGRSFSGCGKRLFWVQVLCGSSYWLLAVTAVTPLLPQARLRCD